MSPRVTALAVAASMITSAHGGSLQVQANDGYMNVRTGPGKNYALVTTVPNGVTFTWPGEPNCLRRQDGTVGADWCKINYNGIAGWVSRAGLLPTSDPSSSERRIQAPSVPSSASNADIICGKPFVSVGDDPRDTNPVVMTEVSCSTDNHSWRVFHHLANGGVVSRSEQYAITDMSNESLVQWQGNLNRNRDLIMIGEVKMDRSNMPVYFEWIYNKAHGNKMEMESRADCRWNNVAQPSKPPVVNRDDYAPPNRDVVRIYTHRGWQGVAMDVIVGGNPLRMVVDTGAALMQINKDLAQKIVREGQGEMGNSQMFEMADGTKQMGQTVIIYTVNIGSHTLRNVQCSIVENGMSLMAFPMLNSLGAFKIDAAAGELVFDPKLEVSR